MTAVLESRTNLPPDILKAPEAFPIEYTRQTPDKVLYNDVVSYLGEYRFKLQTYSFALDYVEGTDGVGHICSQDDGEPMIYKIRRGVNKKIVSQKDARREEADLVGIQSLESQLGEAGEGDFVLWASPPTPGSDEYGDHGFMYLGRVSTNYVDMQAIRIEDKNLDHYNMALSRMTGMQYDLATPEVFIATPQVITEFADPRIKHILYEAFDFQVDPYEREIFDLALEQLSPYIDEFIADVKELTTNNDRIRALNKLEFYAQEIWKMVRSLHKSDRLAGLSVELESLYRLHSDVFDFASRLDSVSGSCGGGSTESADTFLRHSSLKEMLEADKEEGDPTKMHCPECGRKVRYEKKDGFIYCLEGPTDQDGRPKHRAAYDC